MILPFQAGEEIRARALERKTAIERSLEVLTEARAEVPRLQQLAAKLEEELEQHKQGMDIADTQSFLNLHARQHQIETVQRKIRLTQESLPNLELNVMTIANQAQSVIAEALTGFRYDFLSGIVELLSPFYKTHATVLRAAEQVEAAVHLLHFMKKRPYPREAITSLARLAEGQNPWAFTGCNSESEPSATGQNPSDQVPVEQSNTDQLANACPAVEEIQP